MQWVSSFVVESFDSLTVSLPFTPALSHSLLASLSAADAVHNNTSFLYSGRHDHGRLPSLKTSGHSARLLSAIGEAKRLSDEYITGLMAGGASSIGGDNAGGEGESDEESAAPKKARVEEGRC